MASVFQMAINKAAGLEGKPEKKRERLLRLAHEKKSRGPAVFIKNKADDAPNQKPGEADSERTADSSKKSRMASSMCLVPRTVRLAQTVPFTQGKGGELFGPPLMETEGAYSYTVSWKIWGVGDAISGQ